MAAYSTRESGFDGYAARTSRGYSGREGLYSAKGYRDERPSPGRRDVSLSDRLYELSVEAEAREARQQGAEDELRGKLGDQGREIARLQAALETEQRRTREAQDEARSLKEKTRDVRDDFVKELVALRHEVAQRKSTGETLLKGRSDDVVATATKGDVAALRNALQPEPRTEKYGPLLLQALRGACCNGHDDATGLLVRRGALAGALQSRAGTPLHDAARGGSAACLELLLESDVLAPLANQVDILDAADASGRTALMVAAEAGRADAATSLLRAGADAGLYNKDDTAATLAQDPATRRAFASPAERFWNASAAGNRAWRRRDFGAARRHFALALQGAALVDSDEAAPSQIDLARLELNCAKASLRLKDAATASDHAQRALTRHAAATQNQVYANAAAVLGECLEALYDFEGASKAFDDAARDARDERGAQWRARSQFARDCRDATHYAVLAIPPSGNDEAIRKAYRTASLKWHPDRTKGNDPDAAKRSERHFRRVNEAKEVLLDGYKRAMYDVECRRRVADERGKAWPWLAPPPSKKGGVEPERRHTVAFVDGENAPPASPTSPWKAPAPSPIKDPPAAPTARPPSGPPPASPSFLQRRAPRSASPQRPAPRAAPPAPAPPPTPRPTAAPPSNSAAANNNNNSANDADDAWPPPPSRASADEGWTPPASRDDDGAEPWSPRSEDDGWTVEEETAVVDGQLKHGDAWTVIQEAFSALSGRTADAVRDKYAELRKRAEGDDDDDDEEEGFVRVDNDEDAVADLDAHTFFAPRDMEEEEDVEEDSEGESEDDVNFFAPRDDDEPPASAADDLVAQLRDAADWFDRLDEAGEGELSIGHFDELCKKLGLQDVLGQAEMDRQRFFADPGSIGVLRRGTFLGWFAVLLEGDGEPLQEKA